MEMVTAYQAGNRYRLEASDEPVEPVKLGLADEVRVGRSGKGQLLLYRGYQPYGVGVETAIELGWCWLLASGSRA
jgi:hypothetical protein